MYYTSNLDPNVLALRCDTFNNIVSHNELWTYDHTNKTFSNRVGPSNNCLQINNEGSLSLASCNGSDDQKWIPDNDLIRDSNNQCLNLTADGKTLNVAVCNGADKNQAWYYAHQTTGPTGPSTGPTGPGTTETRTGTGTGTTETRTDTTITSATPKSNSTEKSYFESLDPTIQLLLIMVIISTVGLIIYLIVMTIVSIRHPPTPIQLGIPMAQINQVPAVVQNFQAA